MKAAGEICSSAVILLVCVALHVGHSADGMLPYMRFPPFSRRGNFLRKNPALQDSPPAADRFSDIFPLRRSAIPPGGLFMI